MSQQTQTLSRVAEEELVNLNLPLLLARILAAPIPIFTGNRLRALILRLAGFDLGRGTVVWGMPTFVGGPGLTRRLKTGLQVKIGVHCYFDLGAQVSIGDQTTLGPEVMVITSNHQIGSAENRAGAIDPRPVWVGRGCWLGARCILLPGITVGDGCIIGAGAVVTRDVPPNTIVAGIPAKPIRTLNE